MKKWLIGAFVFAFSLTLASIGSADNVGYGGTCADSSAAGDGYEFCTVHLHVGDNKDGGKDDYDFYWETNWRGVDSNTAFFQYYNYYSTGVSSDNDDAFVDPQVFKGSGTDKYIYSCTGGTKVRNGCYATYGFSKDENSLGYVSAWAYIYDPENGVSIPINVKFNPAK